jgi:Big-like domain-containing protein
LPNRIRIALVAALTIVSSLMAAMPAGAVVAPQKVVIIVGPTGALTDNYRSKGDAIAAAAEADGAMAVKVYSPNATWANVKAAVNGANIVVYLGHGNGYPNPYTTGSEPTDRDNGWGLNRTTTNGDSDNWSTTMVYCGEKALLGTLTSSSTYQWAYCGGSTNTDGITPAPNWVMIYSNACYTPGASEGWDTPATESVALQRVRNYSYPPLVLGGGAYFATDMYQGSQQLVDTILRNPGMAFGAIAEHANGYDLSRQRHFDHPDLSGSRIWIQNSGDATSGDYFLAYAGKPALTPSGTTVAYTEPVPPDQPVVVGRYPAAGATGVSATIAPAVRFDQVVTGVSASSFILRKIGGSTVPATVYDTGDSQRFGMHPSVALEAGVSYSLSLTAAITSSDGGSLTPTSWSFTVAGTPSGTTAYDPPVSLVFKMGTHTGYQFSSTGVMTAVKTYTLVKDSSAATSTRRTITNQSGTWFYVTNGVWAGYWLRESSVLYLASAPIASASLPNATYSPAVPLVFKKGTFTGYQFSATGGMTAQKSYTLLSDSWANTSVRKTISNQSGTWYYIVNGVWAGYWLRASDVLYLKT